MDHLIQRYLEEANDLLQELEQDLLILEDNLSDQETVEKVFRVMHTLKGSSSMFGYQKVGDVTHFLENCYDEIRAAKAQPDQKLVSLTFLALDHIKRLLSDPQLSSESTRLEHEQLLEELEKQWHHKAQTPALAKEQAIDQPGAQEQHTYFIYFKPKPEIFQFGSNPFYILDDLAQLGELRTFVNDSILPSLEEIKPELSYLSWGCLLLSEAAETEIQEVFLFVEDLCDLKISLVTNGKAFERLDQELSECLKQSFIQADLHQQLDAFIEELKAALEPAYSENTEQPWETTATNQPGKAQATALAGKSMHSNSIRVASGKLDELMNLISELVATQAKLSLLAEQDQVSGLSVISEEMEKITRRLRDKTFDICLIPIGDTVTRFRRLVRDLSQELHKNIHFEAEGVETELDKNVIEQLTDCLVHIFRNSIDHGIEDELTRQQQGKAPAGKIKLKAYNSGTNVIIEVQDDGAGIDPEKVKAKALQQGLIEEDQELSEQEIFDLLFHPGFSTAREITAVSGRGVGMDVVKKKIKEMRGEVEIHSQLHQETTVKIAIPLTISIIDGLLVRVSQTDYVIPLSFVKKSYMVDPTDLSRSSNHQLILDGQPVPYFDMAAAFSSGENVSHGFAVSIAHENKTVALLVEQIIGEYQAVLKPLGSMFQELDFLSGASLKGDGTVGLVIDPPRLINSVLINQNVLI
jgi:two-component system chemotaxis sensor kinase CheA